MADLEGLALRDCLVQFLDAWEKSRKTVQLVLVFGTSLPTKHNTALRDQQPNSDLSSASGAVCTLIETILPDIVFKDIYML